MDPRDEELGDRTEARSYVLEACRCDPLDGLALINSAAFLKGQARIKAYEEWAQDWGVNQAARRSGQKPCSYAYGHTLTRAPDRNNGLQR